MGRYTAKEMARLYHPGERMTFSRGHTVMTAEHAQRFAYGLVELDRETGKYRRAQSDSGMETMIINETKYRERLLAKLPEASGNRLR